MSEAIQTVNRPVRQITIDTGRPWEEFRTDYEQAVPHFDRLEAVGVVLSNSGWEAITRLSEATAVHGFVNFFVFDPSPVMALDGNSGRAVTYMTGNIVKAERGFRVNPACFLYVPLRVVIAADDHGLAKLSFDHPADLFSAFENGALRPVAQDFCESLASLLEHLRAPVPPSLRDPAT